MHEVPGSGLPASAYAGLVCLSVALFLLWGGPLWKVSTDASQVMRFVVSYAAVIPLAALALVLFGELSWAHVGVTTATAWALKLVITAVLYVAFVRAGSKLVAVEAPPFAAPAIAHPSDDYRAASSPFPAGVLRGVATRDGVPLAGAIIALDRPRPGRALPPSARVELVIDNSRYESPLYLVHTGDSVDVATRDRVLHTVHLRGPKFSENKPIPPGARSIPLSALEAGLYRLACDSHPAESTWVLVVDHPYVVRTDAAGRFELEDVPLGSARALVFAPESERIWRGFAGAEVVSGRPGDVTIPFTPLSSTDTELRN